MRDLSGKTAFVTGAASGLGRAMARSFSAAGMNVVGADVERDALAALTEEFERSNAPLLPLHLDVTDRAAWGDALAASTERFGNVHVVCNNAGVAVGGALQDMAYKDWDWVMGVNVDGVVNGLQTFLPHVLEHGEGGHIVNTASMAGHAGMPGLGVYNASKFAVVGMSEALRADLADSNIGVSVLCPGVVRTKIFESGRNRPSELQTEVDTAAATLAADVEGEERSALQQQMLDEGLDASVIGEMVLDAITHDDFYILSHPELGEATELRGNEIRAANARWASWRKDHSV